MEYTKLGPSSIAVSRLGFGCDQLGLHDWGETNSNTIQAAIGEALDLGVNFFDTADCYGKGNSESLLAEALGKRRHEAVVATKFGVRFDAEGKTYYDNSSTWLDQALDDSLRRLGTDYIDLYQLHYWDGSTAIQDLFGRLEDKVSDGKIRSYGVTNISVRDHLVGSQPPHLVSFSREMSLATRTHEVEVKETAAVHGLTFLSWGSLGQGILTGKYSLNNLPSGDDRRSRPTYKNFHGQKLSGNMKLVDKLREISRKYPDKSISQLAVRALLDRFKYAAVLTGVKSSEQIKDNIGATDWALEQQDLDQLFDEAFF